MTDNHLLHFLYSRITFSSHPILFHHLIIPSSHPLFQPVVIKKKSQNPSFIPLLFHSEQCICLQHKTTQPLFFFSFLLPVIHSRVSPISPLLLRTFLFLFQFAFLIAHFAFYFFYFFLFFAHSLSFCLSFLLSSCIISQFPPTCTP